MFRLVPNPQHDIFRNRTVDLLCREVNLNLDGFHRTVIVMAALLIAGGLVSFAGIRNHLSRGNDQSKVDDRHPAAERVE